MERWVRAVMASAAVVALLGLPTGTLAQRATVSVGEENFRATPGGSILAELLEGTPLSLGEARGQWREATFEAWIWSRSVHEQRAGELDLLVHADGENLRASPNGDRIGRALGGMRLDRLESSGDWIRVRRTGWIWSPSLDIDGPDRPAAPGSAQAPAATAPRPERRFAAVEDGAIVLDAPAGDTLARLRTGASVEVVAREGDWTRVRIEGWTFTGAMPAGARPDGDVLTGLSRDSLQADPEAYRGRVLEWAVQFIALQSAERFRNDFHEGEPFMLTRGPGDDAGFVYVAVPDEWLGRVERLSPLQQVRILGRVRTARSSLTGAPVLDLLELTPR